MQTLQADKVCVRTTVGRARIVIVCDLESIALDATLRFLDEASRELVGEQIYCFTFDFVPEENWLSAAIGTEERLLEMAREYQSSGYGSTDGDPIAALAEWLRWSSPQDGWLMLPDSSAFDRLNNCILGQLEKSKLELYGGHLIDLTKRTLLNEAFDQRLMEMTQGRRVPKLRVYTSQFLIPEVIPWAKETNPPEIFEAFCAEVGRWSELDRQITNAQ